MKTISKSNIKNLLLTLLITPAILLFVSCNKEKTYGIATPTNLEEVRLVDLLADPASFHGKEVILKGSLSKQCASFCDLTLRQDLQSVVIYMEGFKPGKLAAGTPIEVYAAITSDTPRMVVTAKGMKALK